MARRRLARIATWALTLPRPGTSSPSQSRTKRLGRYGTSRAASGQTTNNRRQLPLPAFARDCSPRHITTHHRRRRHRHRNMLCWQPPPLVFAHHETPHVWAGRRAIRDVSVWRPDTSQSAARSNGRAKNVMCRSWLGCYRTPGLARAPSEKPPCSHRGAIRY